MNATPLNLFHIKICGVRKLDDIAVVAESGADAIGLNFFPPSVRFVPPGDDATRALAARATELGLKVVGVFVNEQPADVCAVAKQVGIDAIQLHGDETIQTARQIRESIDLPMIRAIKLPVDGLSAELVEERSRPWIDLGIQLLFDADAGRAHGGSGKQLDWMVIREWTQRFGTLSLENGETKSTARWTLAGGLHPENVSEAMETSRASSVDTASGVEEPKGVKSAVLIRRFVEACKAA